MMFPRICILLGLFAAGWCEDCDFALTLDCSKYADDIECGTDGQDYRNRCYFSLAHCLNNDLHIASNGSCASTGLTTPSVTSGTTQGPLFNGHNVVQDFLCLELMHEVCVMDTEMVCASDGNSYNNFCEFQKQRCSHRDITVLHYGRCGQ